VRLMRAPFFCLSFCQPACSHYNLTVHLVDFL
jgi:hypothetical protein